MDGLLAAADLSWDERRRRLKDGSLRRVAHGVYATTPRPADREAGWRWDLRVAMLACGRDCVGARSAAAAMWGLDGFEAPVPIELNTPVSSRHRQRGVHRVAPLEPIATLGGVDVTGIGQTLIELGAGVTRRRASANDPIPVRPDELVELAVESALRRRLTTEEDLLELLGRCGWYRGGAPMLEEVLERRAFGAPATESYLETRGLQVLRNGGLPPGRRQVAIHDDRGRYIKRVDLLLGTRVVVEFDGRAYHPFEQDHEIWSTLSGEDYLVIAVTYEQVTLRPDYVVRRVAAALRHDVGADGPGSEPRRQAPRQ